MPHTPAQKRKRAKKATVGSKPKKATKATKPKKRKPSRDPKAQDPREARPELLGLPTHRTQGRHA